MMRHQLKPDSPALLAACDYAWKTGSDVTSEQVRWIVEAFLEAAENAPDFVLADPPRAGLGKHAVRALLRLKPKQVTIVACDPSTLARDLAALVAGGYKIEQLTLVDLFPQTFHIETVARLRMGPGGTV